MSAPKTDGQELWRKEIRASGPFGFYTAVELFLREHLRACEFIHEHERGPMNEDVDVVAFGTYTPNKPGINGRAAFTSLNSCPGRARVRLRPIFLEVGSYYSGISIALTSRFSPASDLRYIALSRVETHLRTLL